MSLHQQLKIIGKLGDPDDCPKVVNGLLVLLGGETLETLVNEAVHHLQVHNLSSIYGSQLIFLEFH